MTAEMTTVLGTGGLAVLAGPTQPSSAEPDGALAGRLDVSSAAQVRDTLHGALAARAATDSRTPRELVVDLAGIELVDATGLGVLLGADRRAKSLGLSLVLRDPTPRVRLILRVTRLHRVLTVADRFAVSGDADAGAADTGSRTARARSRPPVSSR